MRARLSLSTRIFLLALANLALLVVAFMLVARHYYAVDLATLLFAPATDRVLDVARQLSLDLEHVAPQEQTGLMGRYAATYGADFYLFLNTGTRHAGRSVTLPPEVVAELTRALRNEGKAGPPPPRRRDGKRPPPPQFGRGGDREGPREGRPPPREGGPPPPPRAEDEVESPLGEPPPDNRRGRGRGAPTIWNLTRTPVFQVSAAGLHWVGVRMPIPDPDGAGSLRGTLLIAAKSFYGTPLFFDFKPWLMAMLAVVTIFAVCWLPFVRSITSSISQLTRATERISQGDFQLHLREDRGDELGQLAAAINRMTGRLAGFVTGQKRFLGDIAHELCAPIARIQFGLGILEQRTPEEHQGAVADVQDEVQQMSGLVSELLSFSKAGMEAARRPLTDIDVRVAVQRAAEREANGKATLRIECDQAVFAQADGELLVRAVSNVVRNAIRYAGDEGPVTLACSREGEVVRILIQDCGPGLEPEDLDRVFAPFYRPEASRNRASGGTGLGLAIVKSCVEACQGTVQCRNRAEGGLEVEIRLKAAVSQIPRSTT